jgi:hypothetical protein
MSQGVPFICFIPSLFSTTDPQKLPAPVIMAVPGKTVTVTFMYENNAKDTWFDLDYYINKHIPAMSELYRPYGLISWFATEKTFDLPGHESPYGVQTTTVWAASGDNGLANVVAAMNDEQVKEMVKEEKNYTNASVKTFIGVVRGGQNAV